MACLIKSAKIAGAPALGLARRFKNVPVATRKHAEFLLLNASIRSLETTLHRQNILIATTIATFVSWTTQYGTAAAGPENQDSNVLIGLQY
jgi:hypothetical protein